MLVYILMLYPQSYITTDLRDITACTWLFHSGTMVDLLTGLVDSIRTTTS